MAKKRVAKREQFHTLRAYVDSFPRGVTQGEIAKGLGLDDSALSSYLTGYRRPSRVTALRLHREHGISLEGLLDQAAARESV